MLPSTLVHSSLKNVRADRPDLPLLHPLRGRGPRNLVQVQSPRASHSSASGTCHRPDVFRGRRISTAPLATVSPTPGSVLSQTRANVFWPLGCLLSLPNLQDPFKAKSGRERRALKAWAAVPESRALQGGVPVRKAAGELRGGLEQTPCRDHGAFALGEESPRRG